MDATDDPRTSRARAVDGLRAIAVLEEYVAAEIDESGYFGEVATALRLSAADRRAAAEELDDPPPSRPSPPNLRLVT